MQRLYAVFPGWLPRHSPVGTTGSKNEPSAGADRSAAMHRLPNLRPSLSARRHSFPQPGARSENPTGGNLMRPEGINFALVGVGGQGTILASDVLAELGLRLGFDVKKAEVHGMSQSGGRGTSHLRWGAQVFSPIIPRGEADVLIAFEKLEAARFIDILKLGGPGVG